jgi:hypothetical protein
MSGPVGISFQHVIGFDYKLITCGVLLLEKEGPEGLGIKNFKI